MIKKPRKMEGAIVFLFVFEKETNRGHGVHVLYFRHVQYHFKIFPIITIEPGKKCNIIAELPFFTLGNKGIHQKPFVGLL